MDDEAVTAVVTLVVPDAIGIFASLVMTSSGVVEVEGDTGAAGVLLDRTVVVIAGVFENGCGSAAEGSTMSGTAVSSPPVTLATTDESSSPVESSRSPRAAPVAPNCRFSTSTDIPESWERADAGPFPFRDASGAYEISICSAGCAETLSTRGLPRHEVHGAAEVDNSANASSVARCIFSIQGAREYVGENEMLKLESKSGDWQVCDSVLDGGYSGPRVCL